MYCPAEIHVPDGKVNSVTSFPDEFTDVSDHPESVVSVPEPAEGPPRGKPGPEPAISTHSSLVLRSDPGQWTSLMTALAKTGSVNIKVTAAAMQASAVRERAERGRGSGIALAFRSQGRL